MAEKRDRDRERNPFLFPVSIVSQNVPVCAGKEVGSTKYSGHPRDERGTGITVRPELPPVLHKQGFPVGPEAAFRGCSFLVHPFVAWALCRQKNLRFYSRNNCCDLNISPGARGSF